MTHLTLDEIADPDTAIGNAHLAGCARCRRAVAEQAEIRALLSSLPDPGPAPAWVMSRVDRALAEARAEDAAVAADATSGPASTFGPDRTIVPLDARRRPDRHLHTWLAAAAAVVVLGGGGLALRGLTHVGGGSDTSSGAASAVSGLSGAGLSPTAIHQSGTDYTPTRLATQLAPLLSGAQAADQSGDSNFSAPTTGGSGRTSGKTPESASGTDAGGDSSGSEARPAPGQPSLLTPSGVAQCLSALGMSGSTVLAVDLARFQGSPAAVIALRPAGSPGRATQVWVVSPDCRPGADGTKFFATLP